MEDLYILDKESEFSKPNLLVKHFVQLLKSAGVFWED